VTDTMYVIVYCNEGYEQGMVYLCRALADDEIMDERKFADQVAAEYDRTIAEPDGYVFNSMGDLRVEFLSHEPPIERDTYNDCDRYLGSTVIWSGESFYFGDPE
jgi:hypothetical protein